MVRALSKLREGKISIPVEVYSQLGWKPPCDLLIEADVMHGCIIVSLKQDDPSRTVRLSELQNLIALARAGENEAIIDMLTGIQNVF